MGLKIPDSAGSRILLGEGLACFIKYFVRSLGKETKTASTGAAKDSSNPRFVKLLCSGRDLVFCSQERKMRGKGSKGRGRKKASRIVRDCIG